MSERWDPWPDLANLLSAGKAILPSMMPASPAGIVRAATDRLVGKRLTSTIGDTAVDLTVVSLEYKAGTLDLAGGRLGDVHITVADVTWPDIPLREVVMLARDVRVRSLPQLSARPAAIELTIRVDADVVAHQVAVNEPRALVQIDADGVLSAHWARRPDWGRIEFQATTRDNHVLLEPTGLRLRTRRLRPPRFLRTLEFPLGELPEGMQLRDVRTRPEQLELHLVAESWPHKLASVPLSDLVTWLSNAALTSTVTRLWR